MDPPIDPNALVSGDRRALALAITLIESTHPKHRSDALELLDAIQPSRNNAIRIGITGPPGVGKSTFIEAIGMLAISQGHRIAVLAVDPSSPIAGGSILGDKTRMENLSRSPDAFIRPSPAAKTLGGVSARTRESILLCEAAGFDIILVETVGVGQSEYAVANMVDFFLALIPPNSGDELQGIKRGIMELVDALVVNKSDGENKASAIRTKSAYKNALTLQQTRDNWKPSVLTCSALTGDGIDTVFDLLKKHQHQMSESGALMRKRAHQDVDWLNKLVDELLYRKLIGEQHRSARMEELKQLVGTGDISPVRAIAEVEQLVDKMQSET